VDLHPTIRPVSLWIRSRNHIVAAGGRPNEDENPIGVDRTRLAIEVGKPWNRPAREDENSTPRSSAGT
jgi:hypothetical protein